MSCRYARAGLALMSNSLAARMHMQQQERETDTECEQQTAFKPHRAASTSILLRRHRACGAFDRSTLGHGLAIAGTAFRGRTFEGSEKRGLRVSQSEVPKVDALHCDGSTLQGCPDEITLSP